MPSVFAPPSFEIPTTVVAWDTCNYIIITAGDLQLYPWKIQLCKRFDIINLIQQGKSYCCCQFGGKKHHVHAHKQRIHPPLMISTLSLTHVCIHLACLQGNYIYLANWHQATKLHYFPNLLRTFDLGFFFHLQLLTFYHSTVNFLHLMIHSNLKCCMP